MRLREIVNGLVKRVFALEVAFASVALIISLVLLWRVFTAHEPSDMRGLEDFMSLTVLALTIPLIARWGCRGVWASIPFGWGTIWLINSSFPHDKWSDIEFTEDWQVAGWLLMSIWSLFIYYVLRVGRALFKWWWALDD